MRKFLIGNNHFDPLANDRHGVAPRLPAGPGVAPLPGPADQDFRENRP